MRLSKGFSKLSAVLAMSLCVVSGGWAQGKPAKKMGHKAKARAKVAAPVQAAAPTAAAGAALPEAANKRDPFVPLVSERKDLAAQHLPPGKAGLVISTVQVDGTVQSGSGMIAVVSNPEERVYFVREGDRLYDGDVEKITLDGVTFKENSKDAFGKPVERTVTKRIYASAGEQQ
ncbi:MAG: pilus assembly protein PilP [Candidatus Acidiferrales bacterium]